jgi:hypothetical protein
LQQNVLAHLPWASTPVLTSSDTDEDDDDIGDSVFAEKHASKRRRQQRTAASEEIWQERHAAEDALAKYLLDVPSTVAFLHGPAGSGKTPMLNAALAGRRVLNIDAHALTKNAADAGVVNALAAQTGYWPVFAFLNSFNTWIDLASVGLIGQKAGLATGVPDQVRQVLSVVGGALGGVVARDKRAREKATIAAERAEQERAKSAEPRVEATKAVDQEKAPLLAPPAPVEEAIEEGEAKAEGWLARLPASLPALPALPTSVSDLAGLPGRLVRSASGDSAPTPAADRAADTTPSPLDPERLRRASAEAAAVRALPVVVLRNFGARGGARADAGEVLDALAGWAAALVEGGIAHVVVVAEKRDDAKRLAQGTPSPSVQKTTAADETAQRCRPSR